MTAVLELRNAMVTYQGRAALNVPDLAVTRGERLAVMGPNGSGKSTLLRVLSLLEQPTAGSVRIAGQTPSGRTRLALRRQMASVFQAPLLCDVTVRKNVEL